MPTTYRVTRNGAVVATGLSAARLMASDYQDDPECEIVEEKGEGEAIKTLRTFAERHGEIEFAYLCTAALGTADRAGEGWAGERIDPALEIWTRPSNWGPGDTTHLLFAAIRSTDTSSPDGAIARSVEV